MHFLQTICLAAPLFFTASAAPLQAEKRGEAKHTVNQLKAGKQELGPVAYHRLLNKFHKEVPGLTKRSPEAFAATPGTGSVSATNRYWDDFYSAPVTIGKQTINMLFDVSAASTWVFSPLLPQAQRGNHQLYNLTGKPNPIEDGKKVQSFRAVTGVEGGGETVSGKIYWEDVSIGGVKVHNQDLGVTNKVDPFWTNTQGMDGVLGLGRDVGWDCTPQTDHNCIPWFSNHPSWSTWTVHQTVFTASLKHHAPGSWDFGYIDSNKYTGAIQTAQLQPDLFFYPGTYEFYTKGYALNKGALTDTRTTNNGSYWWTTVLTSTTGLNIMPPSAIQKIYAKVQGVQVETSTGMVIFPCANVIQIPSFDLDLLGWGATNATLVSMPSNPYAIYGPHATIKDYCYGTHQSSHDEKFMALGNNFMKTQFVIFDYGENLIGFAKQK